MRDLCSHEQLQRVLAGLLTPHEEAAMHQHLEQCESCAAEIEQLSGGAPALQEIAAMFRPDGLEIVPQREECSPVDFVVDHLEPADDPRAMGRLGGYDVHEIIGHGGMGVVLKGFDPELKRFVAIKALAPHLAHSALARKRFAREAQAAAAVVNLHVIAIHQVQPSGKLPFLVMPLLTGESLAQRLKARGNLDLKEVLRIGMQAAAGLAAAHEQGLIHRDVKPANILLEKGIERAVLTDFGLARAADDVSMTRWGNIAGTPEYMSPEQARGEALDSRSDLFSLGCVLYEMATGASPFRTDSSLATMRRLVQDAPQPMASRNAELPTWFISIVDRLLEKDPARRFGSAMEVSELLERCLAHLQQPTNVPLPEGLARSKRVAAGWSRIRWTVIGVVSVVLATCLGGLYLTVTDPPEIAGEWSGEEWGQVVLTKSGSGEYAGSYTDTVGKSPGELQLKWSRIERRFNGTWREKEDRFGELSLRLIGDEIRGALTTDAKSKINPATPRLADLSWTRKLPVMSAAVAAKPTFGPVLERVLPPGLPCREQYFQFKTGQIFIVGNGPGTTREEAAYDEQRIESAGGVDMSASSSNELVFIEGRGCIFTRDVPGLKWDGLSAEEVLSAMKRVNQVEGMVQPRKQDLPITYLFRTERGEVGMMEVLGIGVGAEKRDESRGMRFRYKLVQGGVSAAPPAPLTFGPDQRGLQAALEVTPGEPFGLRLHVRNVSDHNISINGAGYRQEDECLLEDSQGRSVPITKVTHEIKYGLKGGYFGPGQVAVFQCAGLSFQPPDKVPSSASYAATVKPGRYTLRWRARLPGDDVPFAPGAGTWTGVLETGPVTIEVTEPGTGQVAPIADSIYAAILGPVVERDVSDLQTTNDNAALSFDSGKPVAVPATITLDTLTTPSTQPTAVAWARDNQADAIAFVNMDGDKVVKCGLLCPGLIVLKANNKEWVWDSADARTLKEYLQEAVDEGKIIPPIAELTSDNDFPASFLILDTRTHRRGVLQIVGVGESPRSVKIRYRLLEGAPVKAITPPQ